MKTTANKIAHLALLTAIGTILSEDHPLKAYRKLQNAMSKGKGDEFASNFCSPFQLYEYDTVENVIHEIESNQVGLLEFASAAASLAKKKTKDPIQVANILKVVDIEHTQVSQKTRDFLKKYYTMYSDKLDTMGEDLVDVNSANEPDAMSKSRSPKVREEIKKLSQTANNHGAAYVRFVSF